MRGGGDEKDQQDGQHIHVADHPAVALPGGGFPVNGFHPPPASRTKQLSRSRSSVGCRPSKIPSAPSSISSSRSKVSATLARIRCAAGNSSRFASASP